MASITIRDIDDRLKPRLRVQAAHHGHSMEQEAREILRTALSTGHSRKGSLVDSIRARIDALGAVCEPVDLDTSSFLIPTCFLRRCDPYQNLPFCIGWRTSRVRLCSRLPERGGKFSTAFEGCPTVSAGGDGG